MLSSTVSAASTLDLSYKVEAESGALLLLKRPAHKMFLDCDRIIVEYIDRHLTSWSNFANGHLGMTLQDEDFIFVSGHTKTPVWTVAAFSDKRSTGQLVISGGAAPAIVGLQVKMEHAVDTSVPFRTGPLDRMSAWKDDSVTPEIYDQCIFLNFFKMKTRRWRVPKILRAAAGYHQLPDDFDSDDEATSDGRQYSTENYAGGSELVNAVSIHCGFKSDQSFDCYLSRLLILSITS